MTCECGAQICYICRQPVRDYNHFYEVIIDFMTDQYEECHTQTGQLCPLESDNNTIHESDVARGALEARSEMDKQNPDVKLKHDPAKEISIWPARGATTTNL
jgi:TRIAD3 protein (E3 ubiquitin-protein ligase RNF216)